MLHLRIALNIHTFSEQLVKIDSKQMNKRFVFSSHLIENKFCFVLNSFYRYEHVYVRLLKKMGWRRVAALTEDGQKYTEYISHMETVLKENDIELIANKKFPREVTTEAMREVCMALIHIFIEIDLTNDVHPNINQLQHFHIKHNDLHFFYLFVWFSALV